MKKKHNDCDTLVESRFHLEKFLISLENHSTLKKWCISLNIN